MTIQEARAHAEQVLGRYAATVTLAIREEVARLIIAIDERAREQERQLLTTAKTTLGIVKEEKEA